MRQTYQSQILFQARSMGRFTWWDMSKRFPSMKVTSVADTCRILARKKLLSAEKAHKMADPIYEITAEGMKQSTPPPAYFRVTLKKVKPDWYQIESIATNIHERFGRVLASVWEGTACRSAYFTPCDFLNKWQAAQLLNDTSITVIGLEDVDRPLAASSFYDSSRYSNRHHSI